MSQKCDWIGGIDVIEKGGHLKKSFKMIISVASGKGGTGKTTIAVNWR